MSHAIDAVRVAHIPSAGCGQALEFTGPDAAAVLASAATYWSGCDRWLRGERPALTRHADGSYSAVVRLWSAS